MKTSKLCLFSIPLAITASIALSACDRAPAGPTKISYHQIGLCKSYETASGPVTAPSDEAFAVFKIETVDNSQPAKSFVFDPSLFYVDQSNATQKAGKIGERNRRFASNDPRFIQTFNVSGPNQVTIAKGVKRDVNGFAIIRVGANNPSGGPENEKFNFDLAYDDWTSESAFSPEIWVSKIAFDKTKSAQSWTVADDCKALKFN